MKIIITEEQLFTVKSLKGVTSYIENYLSQFEHFVKLEVRVSESSTGYFDTVENPTLIYFEIFVDEDLYETDIDIDDEIQFAMDMYFPRGEDELISVMWDYYFEWV